MFPADWRVMRVRVEFEVKIPVENVTEDQIQEWLRFELYKSSIDCSNPLEKHELEAIRRSVSWRFIK